MPSQLTSERLLDAIAAEGALASTARIFGLSEGTVVTLLQVELPLLARLTGTNPELLRRLFAVSSIPLPVSSRQFYSRMVENPAVRQSAIDDFRVTFGGMVDVATREAARRAGTTEGQAREVLATILPAVNQALTDLCQPRTEQEYRQALGQLSE
ncbi:MAG: hypothetical protein U0031_01925 [Thermomicrobiales bacterium]